MEFNVPFQHKDGYIRDESTIGKNLLSSNISSTCPHNMVNFGPLAAEIVSLVWGTPGNFNEFRVLTALLHSTLVVGVGQTATLNRGHHLYSTGRPSRWALAHISSLILIHPDFTLTEVHGSLLCTSESCTRMGMTGFLLGVSVGMETNVEASLRGREKFRHRGNIGCLTYFIRCISSSKNKSVVSFFQTQKLGSLLLIWLYFISS